jgi:hypothetical protein
MITPTKQAAHACKVGVVNVVVQVKFTVTLDDLGVSIATLEVEVAVVIVVRRGTNIGKGATWGILGAKVTLRDQTLISILDPPTCTRRQRGVELGFHITHIKRIGGCVTGHPGCNCHGQR